MSKYEPLTRHLRSRNAGQIQMKFSEIERILGFDLPKSARKHRPWWSNEAEGTHVQARSWCNAGYMVRDVDIGAEKLTFVQLNTVESRSGRDHPIWGAMAGTITFVSGVDLTAPSMTDDEVEEMIERKARRIEGSDT